MRDYKFNTVETTGFIKFNLSSKSSASVDAPEKVSSIVSHCEKKE